MGATDSNTWQSWQLLSLFTLVLFYFCFLQSILSCVTVDTAWVVYLENKSKLSICFKFFIWCVCCFSGLLVSDGDQDCL